MLVFERSSTDANGVEHLSGKGFKFLKAHQVSPKACSNLEECPLERAVVCKRLLFRFHGLLLSPLALLLSPRPSSLRITAASAAGVVCNPVACHKYSRAGNEHRKPNSHPHAL